MYTERLLQKHVRSFVEERTVGWQRPVAATLTLKKAISKDGMLVTLDQHAASSALRHAMNVMNRRLFGNRVRNGERVGCVAVYEGSEEVRPHYHLYLECPQVTKLSIFDFELTYAWNKTAWGYEVNEIKSCDSGWANYITKLSTKPDYALAIDWLNTTFVPGV
jgi:hypothetical protein